MISDKPNHKCPGARHLSSELMPSDAEWSHDGVFECFNRLKIWDLKDSSSTGTERPHILSLHKKQLSPPANGWSVHPQRATRPDWTTSINQSHQIQHRFLALCILRSQSREYATTAEAATSINNVPPISVLDTPHLGSAAHAIGSFRAACVGTIYVHDEVVIIVSYASGQHRGGWLWHCLTTKNADV